MSDIKPSISTSRVLYDNYSNVDKAQLKAYLNKLNIPEIHVKTFDNFHFISETSIKDLNTAFIKRLNIQVLNELLLLKDLLPYTEKKLLAIFQEYFARWKTEHFAALLLLFWCLL